MHGSTLVALASSVLLAWFARRSRCSGTEARGASSGHAKTLRRSTLAALVCALILYPLSPAHADASEYRFGSDDKLRLRIFEWRPSLDEVFGWEALNNDYTVGATGDLSLPLLGRVQAAGRSRDELAVQIGQQLSNTMGLGRPLTVAIEIIEYRPFYIAGRVANSGAFPYRPGLTVLQAVSIAGGLRTGPGDLLEASRDIINTAGELNVLQMQRDDRKARLARLEAELAQSDRIEFPSELVDRREEPAVATLLMGEQLIFAARRDAYSAQMRALDQLKRNLGTELPSLRAQLRTVETQIRLIREELETVTTLLKSGLANEPRRLMLERELARMEGERLRVEASLLRAKQEISKAEISIVELRSQRAQEVTAALRESKAKLEEVGRKIQTTIELKRAVEGASPYVIQAGTSGRTAVPIYHIVRSTGDGMIELSADESTPVQPGDTVKVDIRVGHDRGSFEAKAGDQMSSRQR
jgi:protein involved in polysaccharide export with SLBB domain